MKIYNPIGVAVGEIIEQGVLAETDRIPLKFHGSLNNKLTLQLKGRYDLSATETEAVNFSTDEINSVEYAVSVGGGVFETAVSYAAFRSWLSGSGAIGTANPPVDGQIHKVSLLVERNVNWESPVVEVLFEATRIKPIVI